MSSIDREDTIKILKDLQKDHLQFCLIPFRQAIERVQALPSTDRPQGEWTQNVFRSDIYRYECSNCKAHHRTRYDYCPSCGARMKGAEDD